MASTWCLPYLLGLSLLEVLVKWSFLVVAEDQVFEGNVDLVCTPELCAGYTLTFNPGTDFTWDCQGVSSCAGTKFIIKSANSMVSDLECEYYDYACYQANVVVFNTDLDADPGFLDCGTSSNPRVGICDEMNITLVDSTLGLMCDSNNCHNLKAYLYGNSMLQLWKFGSLPATDWIEIFLYGPDATVDDNDLSPYSLYNIPAPTTPAPVSTTTTRITTTTETQHTSTSTEIPLTSTTTTETPTQTTFTTTTKALPITTATGIQPQTTTKLLDTSSAPVTSTESNGGNSGGGNGMSDATLALILVGFGIFLSVWLCLAAIYFLGYYTCCRKEPGSGKPAPALSSVVSVSLEQNGDDAVGDGVVIGMTAEGPSHEMAIEGLVTGGRDESEERREVKDALYKVGRMQRDDKDAEFGQILGDLRLGNALMEEDVVEDMGVVGETLCYEAEGSEGVVHCSKQIVGYTTPGEEPAMLG